jgi:large-conductance mechanosensitive channel
MTAKKVAQTELQAFIDFVREQGIVGMAIGLAVGIVAAGTVSNIVDGLVSPLVGFILGGSDLSEMAWNTGVTRGGEELVFGWGLALNSIITLLATALVIYVLVKRAGLEKLDKKKE